MHPIITPDDIARIILSICRSTVQEQTSMPLHELNCDTDAPVEAVLSAAQIAPGAIATHITTMFQCPQLIASLSGADQVQQWANRVYEAWATSPSFITFITSGSTGEPTQQQQNTALLWQEAQELNRALLLERKRIVAAVPCHHVYGFLFTVLLPRVAEIPCVTPVPFPSKSFMKELGAGDFVVAFPLFWNGLITLGLPFPEDVHGSTSTAPCPPATMHCLWDMGLSHISNIYGSSETGGLGYQNHPDAPLALFKFWKRIQPNTADESLLQRIHPEKNAIEAVAVPDNVSWLSEDTFIVLGRKDKIVQVGGINVSLLKTAACLNAYPEVADCVIRLMRPDEGSRLKAFIVPTSDKYDASKLRTELFKWCRKTLRPAERPKKITFGDTLPTTKMGKAKDWN